MIQKIAVIKSLKPTICSCGRNEFYLQAISEGGTELYTTVCACSGACGQAYPDIDRAYRYFIGQLKGGN